MRGAQTYYIDTWGQTKASTRPLAVIWLMESSSWEMYGEHCYLCKL